MVSSNEDSGVFDLNDQDFTIKKESGADNSADEYVSVWDYDIQGHRLISCQELSEMIWQWGCASSGEYNSVIPDQKYMIILDRFEAICPNLSLEIIDDDCN